ncbi:MAG: transporter substrate-binding domain-containing protein [Pseudomonadota bacterium]
MGNTNKTWKIGLLYSQTGVTSVIEQTQLNATLLAVREINLAGGIQGIPLEAIVYDPSSDPEKYFSLAKKLVEKDRINMIFGCYMSSARKAVLPIVENYNGLLWYSTLYEGYEFSNNVIYTGAAPNQNSALLSEYLLNKFGARYYFIGSNYIYPYESNRIMRQLLEASGREVVAERYIPLMPTQDDIDYTLSDILEKRPNVIFSTIVGSGTKKFYRKYWSAGMRPESMPIVSLTTSEAEVAEIGVEAASGHITASPYFQSVNSPENHHFVKKYHDMFGSTASTNACCEAAYFQVHIYANALRSTAKDDTDLIRSATLGASFNAPQGVVTIDKDNHHSYLWPKIGRINHKGQFDIIHSANHAVKPDPYMVHFQNMSKKMSIKQEQVYYRQTSDISTRH